MNNDFFKDVNELFDLKGFIVGLIGGIAGLMWRAHKGLIKSKYEGYYMVFVGSFFAAFFTEPIMSYVSTNYPGIESLKRIRDAFALVIGVSGWYLISFLIEDLPPLFKRLIYKNLEFVKDETKAKKDVDSTNDHTDPPIL